MQAMVFCRYSALAANTRTLNWPLNPSLASLWRMATTSGTPLAEKFAMLSKSPRSLMRAEISLMSIAV
jgi:hypothetical protein